MKNVMKLSSLVSALVIIFTLAIAAPVKANDEKKDAIGELKVIGNYNDQPVFLLSLNNKVEDEYTIIIRDSYDNVLYTDRVKGANITKKFQLAEDISGESLSVEVKSRKNNQSEVYRIESSRRLVQETVVNKVK
jgi:hypothetical protein